MDETNELTLMPRLKAAALRERHPANIESFYHLKDGVAGRCCCGTACFAARHLNPQRWREATSGGARVYCLGKCYLAPAAASDNSKPQFEVRSRVPIVLERIANGGAHNIEKYIDAGGYRALEKALALPPEKIIQEVEFSELRGRGGAAYSTGKKWRLAATRKERQKFIVANADEGDPGAYIDRFIIEEDPHCLIEGMALAGYAVGASKGWIYLRAEYPRAAEMLQRALEDARQAGFLGEENEFAFDIHLVVGAGSYLCGEETALLNAIEGNRPVAMSRPPYATDHGLFNKPTVINNVETLANIPWIVRHGGEAYRALGFSNSRGTKVISLNSLFRRPGLYEIEFGISLRQIVEELGGGLKSGELKALMIGGPLAGIVPPEMFDTAFGFEELRMIGASVGHGGVIAFDERTSIPELVHHIFAFGSYESCGKCTPCRLGTAEIEKEFENFLANRDNKFEEREWDELIAALRMTSLCGHGIGLAEFAQSVSRYFGKELAACFR